MLNHITLMGRLTKDPELRYTPSGTPVASFTLAVDRDYSKDGDRDTDFINFIAWRGTAEFVSKYFQKGSMAVVSGRLQIKEWKDKNDSTHRDAEIVADNVYFGEGKHTDGNAQGSPRPAGRAVDIRNDEPSGSAFSELDNGDGDLPF